MNPRVGRRLTVVVVALTLATVACTPGTSPVPVLRGATSLSSFDQSCAVVAGGRVECWGLNDTGQLGDLSLTSLSVRSSNVAVGVTGLSGAIGVASGAGLTCALMATGHVQCWGDNVRGGLGDGNLPTNSPVPVSVVGISDATQIDASAGSHVCALVTGGVIKCWGDNIFGDLGIGAPTPDPPAGVDVPTAVVGISGATQVAGSCALMADGSVECWGLNDDGQLGDGTNTTSYVPVDVVGIVGATQIVGDGSFNCALVAGGAVKCWGYGLSNNLGNGSGGNSNVPVDVVGISGATQIAAGSNHACAVIGGQAKCWGDNGFGELGDGTRINRAVPVDVAGLSGIVQIRADGVDTCALVVGATVKCWGYNTWGELGDGTNNTYSPHPVDVVSLN